LAIEAAGSGRRRPCAAVFPACSGRSDPVHLRVRPIWNNPHMRAILDVILLALQLYVWVLIAYAVFSWLVAFNVVNMRNQFVAVAGDFLYRITEPVLAPIRNLLPNFGGIDISMVIAILLIFLIERIILYYIYPNVI
jgi:YggT family protein